MCFSLILTCILSTCLTVMSQHIRIAWSSLLVFCLVACTAQNAKNPVDPEVVKEGVKTLGDNIIMVLEHYKQEDPLGLPGLEVPDPMPIPDMKRSFSVATMNFEKLNIKGLKKFKILSVKSELSSMAANAALKIDTLQVVGNYTMSTWLSKSKGPFQVNLTDVFVEGFANLGVELDGKVRVQDIKMDITFGKISMNFENLGFMFSLFQGILNSVGTFLFDSIKPFVLKEAYATIRKEMNNALADVVGDLEFPNSISPLDKVVADARQKIQAMNLDPYYVKDYNSSAGIFKAQLSHTWVQGISSFYRVSNISLSMENNTIIADFEIGTQKVEGQTQWDIVFMAGLTTRAGTASFSVDYITARVILGQPLDTRKKPQFRDLQLDIGNIQVRCDGAGTVDYVVEFVVNVLPNLLRSQISDALEGPIQDKVQEMFNQVNVEELIKSKIPEIEQAGKNGLKLSDLKQVEEPPKEEDEFWRFD